MITRRCFFGRAAAAAVTTAGAAVCLPRLSAVPPLERKGKPQLRLSLAAYSFRDFFNAKEAARRITLNDFIDFCADHGCVGTELTSYYFPKEFGNDYLVGLKRHAFLRGLAISGTAVGNNFTQSDGPDLDREIAAVKLWIDHAAVMGAPHIRVFAGAPKGIDLPTAKKQCVRALEECGAYAAEKGIWLGLENHGGIVADVAVLLEIVQAVQSPWVGVNLDSGNFYGPGDPYDDMARLAPYAVNVQIKVEINRAGKGKEQTDLARVMAILRQANYQGFVALEYESPADPWKAVPEWLERMRAAMAG
ncbi:MAG TPA: sugar phosphate isomerase/epimerase family protein [Verrucomicrobiota bacterium]|nr:sugar phosphate isomerase/epimerase family protein [Verrucomicrobiota bacterium]